MSSDSRRLKALLRRALPLIEPPPRQSRMNIHDPENAPDIDHHAADKIERALLVVEIETALRAVEVEPTRIRSRR